MLLENACTLREEVDASGIPRIHIPMRKVVEFLVNEVAVGHLLQTDSAYFPLLEPPAPNPG